MNQYAIFYLLTFTIFYVTFASADFKTDKVCKLREVKVNYTLAGIPSQSFDVGKVYLYKVIEPYSSYLQVYVVGDDSKKRGYSDRFSIGVCNTLIFEKKIEIIVLGRFITVFVDEDPFDFVQKHEFFLLNDFSDEHKFSVTGILQDGTELENVSTIKAKAGDFRSWAFIVLDRKNKPHLLFSTKAFKLPGIEDDKVSITLETWEKTSIIIKFRNSAEANKFYEFVSQFFAK